MQNAALTTQAAAARSQLELDQAMNLNLTLAYQVETGVQFSSYQAALKHAVLGMTGDHIALSASLARQVEFETSCVLPNQGKKVSIIQDGQPVPARATTILLTPEHAVFIAEQVIGGECRKLIVAAPTREGDLQEINEIGPMFRIVGARFTDISRDEAIKQHRTARSQGYSLGLLFPSADEAFECSIAAIEASALIISGAKVPHFSAKKIELHADLFAPLGSLYSGEHSLVICDSRVHGLDIALLDLVRASAAQQNIPLR